MAGACALAAVTMAAVVAKSELHPGAVLLGVLAVVALVVGLPAGFTWAPAASASAQVGAATWAAWVADDPASAGWVLIALGTWVSFELGVASCETRGDVTVTSMSAWARVTDVVGLAALGGVVAAVALVVAGSGPDASSLVLRAGGLAVAGAVIYGLLLLSRPRSA
jgi:hypothetical protein